MKFGHAAFVVFMLVLAMIFWSAIWDGAKHERAPPEYIAPEPVRYCEAMFPRVAPWEDDQASFELRNRPQQLARYHQQMRDLSRWRDRKRTECQAE